MTRQSIESLLADSYPITIISMLAFVGMERKTSKLADENADGPERWEEPPAPISFQKQREILQLSRAALLSAEPPPSAPETSKRLGLGKAPHASAGQTHAEQRVGFPPSELPAMSERRTRKSV